MCGFGNNGFGNTGCFQPCIILLIIVIFKNLDLLDTKCNPNAKTALTLLFLFWICGCNGFGGNFLTSFNQGCNRCCC